MKTDMPFENVLYGALHDLLSLGHDRVVLSNGDSSTLPPQYREVLLLIAYEGLTPSDGAVVCGISPEAFRQRLSRARAALAEMLDLTPTSAKRRFGT